MFRWIIGTSLQFRFLVLGAAAALVALGALQLEKMPVDVLPEFAPPTVEVQTEAIGLSADEVESLITFGLEELLTGVPWLESTRSKSVTGLSTITLIFKRGTDIVKARQMVQERLALAYTLPNVATPPVILQPVSATSRFMMIGISSDTIDPTELSLLARWTIKPRLVGVPGVANVAIWGQRLRQLHVHIDPDRLRDAKLTQEDIITAAGDALWVSPLTFLRASAPGSGGWIDNHNQRLGVEHAMPIERPEDLAKVPVTSPSLLASGRTMTLGDVTEVTFAHPPLIGDAIVNGGNGLLLVIDKFPSASTPEVTRGVEEALGELARGLPGVRIDTTVFRLATYVEESLSNLTLVILVGAGLVALVLAGFLVSWQATLVSIVAIPLSLLAAVGVLNAAGATINTMVLAGLVIALGVVIDDAIVDADRLLLRLRESGTVAHEASLAAMIRDAVLASRNGAVFSALIVLLSVTPIFFMGGVSGAFLEPLALAYALAVAASMLVGLVVAPALWMVLLRRAPGAGRESAFARWLRGRYEPALRQAVAHAPAVLGATVVVVVFGLGIAPWLGQSLLPPLAEGAVIVNWATPPGTSHVETYRITARVSRELRALPGVRNVGAHVGRAVTGDQVVGVNKGQIWISLDPRADYERSIAAIRDVINGYPGVEHGLQAYLRDKISEALTGQSRALVVRLYGPSRDVLRQQAAAVTGLLAGVAGVVDLRVDDEVEEPQVEVKVDLDAAGSAGVKPGDARRSAATVFSGIVVGYLFRDQKIYEVVVWGAPEMRRSLTDLRSLLIETTDRSHVRLDDIATVSVQPTPTIIRHERIAPYLDVVFNVSGRDPGSVAEEVEDRLRAVQFPLENHAELLGESVEREDVQQRSFAVALAAMLGILLLLQAHVRSWRLALLGFLALPAAAAGGVFATIAAGGVISLGSIVGFLAIIGLAARNSMLLIDHYQRPAAGARARIDVDLVVRGSGDRLLPILASAAATVAALAPLLAFGFVPGLEIVRPTAVVMIGGTVMSTLFALFVLPLLIRRFGETADHERELELGNETDMRPPGQQ